MSWHFANITSRWTKRGLVAAGFGLKEYDDDKMCIFSIAELGGSDSPAAQAERERKEKVLTGKVDDIENIPSEKASEKSSEKESLANGSVRQVLIQGINRPLFHFDLQEAVESAVQEARTKTF